MSWLKEASSAKRELESVFIELNFANKLQFNVGAVC